MENREKEIFRRNYTRFCDILKHENTLHPDLVVKDIISPDDLDEIRSKSVVEKGPTLLRHITGPLDAGSTYGFYGLLDIMKNRGKPDTQKFASDIERQCQPNINGTYASYNNIITKLDTRKTLLKFSVTFGIYT